MWWVVPLFWLPIISFVLWRYSGGMSPLAFVTHFLLGMLYWTLVEYSLHRFLFHMDVYMPDRPKVLALHFLLHGVHHKAPNDRYRLAMPPLPAVVLCVIVGYISRGLTLPL